MIEFTYGELRCLADVVREHRNLCHNASVPVPQWVDETHKKLNEAIAKLKPHVLVPADECEDRLDTTDDEGWVQRCICGRSFVTSQRTGQCPQCGMFFEILKNHKELKA